MESWADIVKGYSDGRAWADIVDDESSSGDDADQAQLTHTARTWANIAERGSAAKEPDKQQTARDACSQGCVTSTSAVSAVADVRGQQSLVSQDPICPGDPVGIRAIQSILMSATQMNLSHFHTAGMDTAVDTSAPTAAEAMNSAYANAGMTFESGDDVYALRKQIVGATLKSFVITVGGSFTVLQDRENIWYEALGRPMYSGSVLRIYIDYKKMKNHGLTLADLAQKSFSDDVVTNVSPDFMGMIDVEVPNGHLSQWLSRMGYRVCGTFNIRSCDKAAGDKKAVTRGTDVLAVSRISSVDKRTITSNNVAEVEAYFGIEAAASVLYTLTGSRVVSDFMARTGKVLPFMKNSTEVRNKGLLSSMGFERPKEDIKMTIVNQSRQAKSVYESIITGADPDDIFAIKYQDTRSHVSRM